MTDLTFSLGKNPSRVIFSDLDTIMHSSKSQVLYVVDEFIYQQYKNQLDPLLALPGRDLFVLPSGEASKSWDQIRKILEKAFDMSLARDSQIIGIGGGVVTDAAAFAASIYLRGVDLVLVPTTLLGMVDAAFGGKTGINFGGFKNMVGTFYPAREMRVSTSFLASLTEREYRSGLAEVIKSSLLDDANLYDLLKNRKDDVFTRKSEILDEIVFRSLGVKGRIVEADLTEQGIRAHLNLGHTFAHALETVTGLGTWSHGEAVAWGIGRALELGVLIGVTPRAYADEVISLLKDYEFPLDISVDPDQIIQATGRDKKKHAGKLRFILQSGPSATLVREVPEQEVRKVL